MIFSGKSDYLILVYQEVFKLKSEAYSGERQVKLWKNKLNCPFC